MPHIDAGAIMISRHAEQRARERMGLKRKAVVRTVLRAWETGAPQRGTVNLERGITVGLRDGQEARVWGGFAFVFAMSAEGRPTLVTVLRRSGDATEWNGWEERRAHDRYRGEHLRSAKRRRSSMGKEIW